MTSAEDQALLRYLPRYRRAAFDPSRRTTFPGVSSVPAALLRSDIVGFTLLTDRMVQGGIGGAEELAGVLGQVISRMAEIAWMRGGDLVSWEGDAGTFAWVAHSGLTLEEATLLAVQTAATIHREAETWLVDGSPVRFRSAVSCGSLSHFEIGGRDEEWRSVLAGPALTDVSSAEKAAAPGQTLISRAALALVGSRCHYVVLEEGMAQIVSVVKPADSPEPQAAPSRVATALLRKVVPRIFRGGDHNPSLWTGEFRSVTAAYMTLRHPEYASPEDTLALLQDAAQRVQACLNRWEGQIYEILASQEAITFITVFGLPPLSHEDDGARAVRSALAIHREWGALGLTSSTGIATGRIFCGIFQTRTDRAVLALVGPVMNLAARLMQLQAGVVCDEETRLAGRQSGRILARELTPRTIKGKTEPITAYAAYDVDETISRAGGAEEFAIIGRERELAALSTALARTKAGGGCVVVIEGDAGIGKSTLASRAAAQAAAAGMLVLTGAGDSGDQTTTYLGWRPVFLDVLKRSDLPFRAAAGQPSSPNAAASQQPRIADDAIIRLSAFSRLSPLLMDMLGLEADDNEETALLRGQPRADALARLLKDLLWEAARNSPILLVMEDLHWLDSASLSLFASLGASPAPMMLLGATRGSDANPAVRKSLASLPDVQWLPLEPMDVAQTGRLVARTLGARQADDDLAAMFRDRTGGNPLFVEELSRMAFVNRLLFIDGVVQARSSVAAAKGGMDDILERQGLPGTIEGVIRRRLDDLNSKETSVLRSASVVGQAFERDLCAAGASKLTPAEVDQSLVSLIGLGLIEASNRTPGEFAFRHAVLRDAVYNAMSFAERRQLHDAIGTCLEARAHVEDVSALLARHFLQAQRHDKAIAYLITAGEIAVNRYANEEAVGLLMRANELVLSRQRAGSDAGMSKTERARLSFLLGRAFLGLSRYADSRLQNEAGLRFAGYPPPRNAPGVALAILGQSLKLVRYAIWPSRREAPQPQKDRLRASVLAYEALAETYFFSGDTLRTLYAAMTTLNMSERIGHSAELARGCATLSGIMGFFRLRKASAHYSSRALQILASLDDPAAETWVFTLLGFSKLGEGQWEPSRKFFADVATAATKIGDRRRWRDGVENIAVIEACRGNWKEALVGLTVMFDAAKQDRDRRYMVVADRERAYCRLHLGEFDAVELTIAMLKEELERGLGTEELPTRLDCHAFAATLALERGNFDHAASEAHAATKAIVEIGEKSSVVNTYCAMLLVARVFANLWIEAQRTGNRDRRLLKSMATVRHALSSQAWSFPIAAPSAAIVQGYLCQFRGRTAKAAHFWRRAAASASRIEMTYEAGLALQALGQAGPLNAEPVGLSFLKNEEAKHAG